jgi:hypothetical protein
MISRRLIAAVALLCALIAPAHAQKTKAAILAEIPILCPAGQLSGLCTVPNMQEILTDTVNAIPRNVLTSPQTYYVRAAGSDTNCSGLVNADDPGTGTIPRACAFATPQQPVNVALYNLDLNNQNVTINLVGSFTTGINCSGAFVGGGSVTITTPTSASITTTNATAIVAAFGCNLTVSGNITLSAVSAGGDLMAYANGIIYVGAGITTGASPNTKIQAGWIALPTGYNPGPGTIAILGNYTDTGNSLGHYHATTEGSLIEILSGITVTEVGTPAYSGFYASATKGMIYGFGATWSGAATGPRYYIHNAGIMIGITRTALPGNAPGTIGASGTLATSVSDADSDFTSGNITGQNYVATTPVLVSALPSCTSALQGARSFVTDANSTAFHATAVGSGSNKMAVVCDGTNWYLD